MQSSLLLMMTYARTHHDRLFRALTGGLLAGLVISYSLPQTYTVEIVNIPKVTWEISSISKSDKILSLLSGTLINNNPDDPDCFRPSFYPYITASTPFLLRMAETKIHTQQDTTTITLGHYVNHIQKTPWWNFLLGLPSYAVRSILSVIQTTDEPTDIHSSSSQQQSLKRYTSQQLRTARKVFACLKTKTNEEKFTVSFIATAQDPVVATLVADSFRMQMQHYIQYYREQKAQRHLAYRDSILRQAKASFHEAQESLANYQDRHHNLRGYQNYQEQNKLQIAKTEATNYYIKAEQEYREAKNRISAVTPLYSVITPAEVPQEPDGPGRMTLALLITLFCIALVPLSDAIKHRLRRLRYWKRKPVKPKKP